MGSEAGVIDGFLTKPRSDGTGNTAAGETSEQEVIHLMKISSMNGLPAR